MKSYRFKVMILIIIFIFSSMAMMFYFVNQELVKDKRAESFITNMNYAYMAKNSIDLHTDALLHNLKILAELDEVQKFQFEDADEILKSAVDHIDMISQMYVTDSSGMQIYKTSFVDTLGDRSDRVYFQNAIKGETYISDAIISRSTGRPICVAAVPIYDDERIVGTLGASIELAYLMDIMESIEISENGYGMILDRAGHVISHPEGGMLAGLNTLSSINGFKSDLETTEGEGIIEYQGQERLLSYTTSEVAEWTVIIQVPVEEAYRNLSERKMSLIYFSTILFIASILITIPVSKRFYEPLREIKDVLNGIGNSNFNVTFSAKREDELGIIQDEIEMMAKELSLTHEEFEKRVYERTQELNKTNEALRNAMNELELLQDQLIVAERFKALHEMGIRMSHEINTAVGNSLMAASYIGDESKKVHQRFLDHSLTQSFLKDYIKTMMDLSLSIQRQLDQINKVIRALRKTDEFKNPHNVELIDLYEEVRKARDESLYKTASEHVSLEIECPRDVQIEYYTDFIGVLLIELINNSIMHGFADSKKGEIRINVAIEGHELKIFYEDDGIGISDAFAGRIFEPFAKADMADSGKGIGLSKLYNMVINLGKGEISYSSEEERGIRFIISLPI